MGGAGREVDVSITATGIQSISWEVKAKQEDKVRASGLQAGTEGRN